MVVVPTGRRHRNSVAASTLPLFEQAEANRIRELPLPARRLARRWGVGAATARVLAELAGFCLERD